jgi:hypothetical protein
MEGVRERKEKAATSRGVFFGVWKGKGKDEDEKNGEVLLPM